MFMLPLVIVKAQTASLSLGNVGICENSTISVPLTGNDLNGIGALTLFIYYNDQDLAFNAIENPDPQLSGLIYNALANPSRIAIVWSKIAGASFNNATLLHIKFDVLHKNSTLAFAQDSCEIADISIPPQLITATYNNGSVFDAIPDFSQEPENTTAVSLSDVSFLVTSPNASGYSWQESRNSGDSWANLAESGNYAGTNTNFLTINNVSTTYNQYRYRCILDPDGCNAVSRAAILSVDSIAGISPHYAQDILKLSTNPNPFNAGTTVSFTVPENGFVTIKIFSMTGQLMETPVEQFYMLGTYRVYKNFVSLPRGIYFCNYVFRNAANVYETNKKMIKIG
jgi:hypothetical protein